jgi:hypothetical protein
MRAVFTTESRSYQSTLSLGRGLLYDRGLTFLERSRRVLYSYLYLWEGTSRGTDILEEWLIGVRTPPVGKGGDK